MLCVFLSVNNCQRVKPCGAAFNQWMQKWIQPIAGRVSIWPNLITQALKSRELSQAGGKGERQKGSILI